MTTPPAYGPHLARLAKFSAAILTWYLVFFVILPALPLLLQGLLCGMLAGAAIASTFWLSYITKTARAQAAEARRFDSALDQMVDLMKRDYEDLKDVERR